MDNNKIYTSKDVCYTTPFADYDEETETFDYNFEILAQVLDRLAVVENELTKPKGE